MKQFAVNVSTIFTEVPFIERFQKAKEHGFTYVECQFPYSVTVDLLKNELQKLQLSLVLINMPPGSWENGDRGLAIDEKRRDEFKKSVDQAIHYAENLGVKRIHCMAGIMNNDTARSKHKDIYMENLLYASKQLAQHELTLLIEPINQIDMPNYFLSSLEAAVQIIQELNEENVNLQFDFYHIEKMYGESLKYFEKYMTYIEHVQIADVPGRHELGTGNLNYQEIFTRLNQLKYNHFIGLEYTPLHQSDDSFGWLRK